MWPSELYKIKGEIEHKRIQYIPKEDTRFGWLNVFPGNYCILFVLCFAQCSYWIRYY